MADANSSTALMGRWGKFEVESVVVARATQWSVSKKLASTAEWGDSDSKGFTNRAPGRKDATFNAEGKFDTEDAQYDVFQPEDCCAVKLYLSKAPVNDTDRSTNAFTVTSLYWDFPRALCSEFAMTVNIDSEEVIGWTSAWGADGEFTYPGES